MLASPRALDSLASSAACMVSATPATPGHVSTANTARFSYLTRSARNPTCANTARLQTRWLNVPGACAAWSDEFLGHSIAHCLHVDYPTATTTASQLPQPDASIIVLAYKCYCSQLQATVTHGTLLLNADEGAAQSTRVDWACTAHILQTHQGTLAQRRANDTLVGQKRTHGLIYLRSACIQLNAVLHTVTLACRRQHRGYTHAAIASCECRACLTTNNAMAHAQQSRCSPGGHRAAKCSMPAKRL